MKTYRVTPRVGWTADCGQFTIKCIKRKGINQRSNWYLYELQCKCGCGYSTRSYMAQKKKVHNVYYAYIACFLKVNHGTYLKLHMPRKADREVAASFWG